MAREIGSVCKLCRREGEKLYLKGARCESAKCAIVKRNYQPGQHSWSRGRPSDFGVRLRNLTLSTMQGISLRVAPNFSGAYAGGLVAQVEILPALRFLSFVSWQVNYVGESAAVDAGGALGGGFEALLPGGRLGKLKLGLLGRLGLGVGGAAVYGRGAVGLQLGYRFN